VAEKRILERERWQLRHAADTYWLLDMKQGPENWRPPLTLNRAGAELWQLFDRGIEEEVAAEMLCRQYRLDRESALKDVRDFLAGLETQGIVVG